MIYWLSGETVVVVSLQQGCAVCSKDIAPSLSKIYKSRHYFKIFYFYININCKRVAALFLPMPDWAGGNIAQTYFYAKTCSARLGLDWTRLGIKGFATFATLSSFLSCIVSTRSSIYSRYFHKI